MKSKLISKKICVQQDFPPVSIIQRVCNNLSIEEIEIEERRLSPDSMPLGVKEQTR